METDLEFLTDTLTVLDTNKLLVFNEKEQKAYLQVKNKLFDEKLLVYDRSKKSTYLQNEIHDILDRYYQSYYEMMEQTFCPYEQMNFMDVALGVAAGMRIYNLYAPAFLELRKIMNLHYQKKEVQKPYGWNVGEIKFTDKFKYLYELAPDQYGKMVYTYDDYNFPEEVFFILKDELRCIEPVDEKMPYSNWKANAWTYKL